MNLLKRSRNHVQGDISAQVKVWTMDMVIHVVQEHKAINLHVNLVLLDTFALMIKCKYMIMKILVVSQQMATTVEQARIVVIDVKITAVQSVKHIKDVVMFFDDL